MGAGDLHVLYSVMYSNGGRGGSGGAAGGAGDERSSLNTSWAVGRRRGSDAVPPEYEAYRSGGGCVLGIGVGSVTIVFGARCRRSWPAPPPTPPAPPGRVGI